MLRSFDIIVPGVPNGGGPRVQESIYEIRRHWMTDHGHLGVITGPVRIAVSVFLPAPKGNSQRWRRNFPLPTVRTSASAYARQVRRALLGYAYRNDNQIVTLLSRKRYALDPEGRDTPPRWVITIEEIVEGVDEDEGQFAGIFGSQEPDRHRALDYGVPDGTVVDPLPNTAILRADGRIEHPAAGEDVVLYDGDRVVAYT